VAESIPRRLIKGLTWRITGTLDTVLISYFVTGDTKLALKIGVIELATKIVLFYLHERVWGTVKWGKPEEGGKAADSHARSLTKGITWRLTGTLDTIWIAYYITRNTLQALSIGTIEVFTKIGLYYLHERIWNSISWGKTLITTDMDPYHHPDKQHDFKH
jgi:uncharacterized membrane protein